MHTVLDDIVQSQKSGSHLGITSVCSAHPLVVEAALRQAREDDSVSLIEATANQVDQYGGYTGMQPLDFRNFVENLAARCHVPLDRVILGGDHLGPNRWLDLPSGKAMEHARQLVAAYVAAGFTKLHLDCSVPCADDRRPLSDKLVALRTAHLARVAEDTASQLGREGQLRYVIGTDVPLPGGAHDTARQLVPTSAAAAQATLCQHRDAMAQHGLHEIWPRVIALVVQPGMEFDQMRVIEYRPEQTLELSRVLDDEPNMIFEAHSTDYQTRFALSQLVANHWAILKVGPSLTFALREALFALAAIESELMGTNCCYSLPNVVERRMVSEPSRWTNYYSGDKHDTWLARRYSFSDRVRYYWPDHEIAVACAKLFSNLTATPIPLPVLSAHFPDQYRRVRNDSLAANDPRELVIDKIRDVLRDYASACNNPEQATQHGSTTGV